VGRQRLGFSSTKGAISVELAWPGTSDTPVLWATRRFLIDCGAVSEPAPHFLKKTDAKENSVADRVPVFQLWGEVRNHSA